MSLPWLGVAVDPESDVYGSSRTRWIWCGALGIGVFGVYIVGRVKCVQWCVKGVVGMSRAVLPTGDYYNIYSWCSSQ